MEKEERERRERKRESSCAPPLESRSLSKEGIVDFESSLLKMEGRGKSKEEKKSKEEEKPKKEEEMKAFRKTIPGGKKSKSTAIMKAGMKGRKKALP